LFLAAQVRLPDPSSYPYLLLNLVGSAVPAVLTYREPQWSFLLLEGVWALVSAWGVLARLRGGAAAAS
jgi:hypothetical protein